jgi:hypothetical protein
MSRRNVRFHAMNRFTALVAALPLTVGVLLPAPARAADLTPLTTLVSSVISSASVLLGTTSVISGSVAGPAGRPVSLQVKVASGWRTLRSSTTTSTHTYRLAAPSSWLGGHTLRVVAPSTTDAPTAVSSSRLFSVRPTWSPAGTSSDWHWLSSSHARFNPCAPITWRFNQNGGYSGSLTDLKGAFRRLSQATGMTFTYKGTTLDLADPQRAEVEDRGGEHGVGAGVDRRREVLDRRRLPRWRSPGPSTSRRTAGSARGRSRPGCRRRPSR